VQFSGLGPAIDYVDSNERVVNTRFGLLNEDIEVSVFIKHAVSINSNSVPPFVAAPVLFF
jgi:hypothetical protein